MCVLGVWVVVVFCASLAKEKENKWCRIPAGIHEYGQKAQTKEIIKLWLMIQKGTLIVENDTLNFCFYNTDKTL